jgi:hypothetical protein
MTAYPEPSYTSFESTMADPSGVPLRVQLVKELDEHLSRLDDRVNALTDRIAPALSPLQIGMVEGAEKQVEKATSDVVAHLKHTLRRVSEVSERIADLTSRVEL